MEFMTLEQLRESAWIIPWSGGKDSTATVILCHKYGIPIKRIIYVRMMWDETLPATLPVMTEFVDNTRLIFESWGYSVDVVPSLVTAKEITEKIYKKAKNYPERNGKYWGISAFARGFCKFTGVKESTVKTVLDSNENTLVGYAIDEVDRLHRLTEKKQSIMCTLGITEQQAFSICREAGLLSPLYELKVFRDGCWFCPNARADERVMLKELYPELVVKIKQMIEMCDYDLSRFQSRNKWLQDYFSGKL